MNKIWPKGVFPVKNRKKSEHHHWILHIRISLATKFHFQQISDLETKFAQKKDTSGRTQKNKCHHWVVHIRISLSTKLQPKLTTLIFRPNLSKQKNRTFVCVHGRYIKLFRTGADRRNGIVMSLLLLVAGKKKQINIYLYL